jgi:hypothetical protein
MKKHLKGQHFHSNKNVQNEVKKRLRAQEGLEKLIYRYDKCLNWFDDYVEK